MNYPTLKDGSRNWCATCRHNGEECEYGEECSYQTNFDGTFNHDLKPTYYDDKPKTNADRIRAMSDEELAAWYCHDRDCRACEFGASDGCHLLDWLKAPVEETKK